MAKQMTVKNFHSVSAKTFPATSASVLSHGEIAIVGTKKYEDIYIKNSDGDIVGLRESVISVTYDELVNMETNGYLKPGMYYRITDYVTTYSDFNEEAEYGAAEGSLCEYYAYEEGINMNGSSIEKPFDLIVQAISKNEISPKAHAIQHDGDTYFQNCDLSKWEIWYTTSNNNNNYFFSTKGTIYRMIDEFGNDAPYDFKNIKWEGWFTFGYGTDHSLYGNCKGNKIYGYKIVLGGQSNYNYIGEGSKRIIIGINSSYNVFGKNCRGYKLGNYCSYNKFGDNCSYHNDEFYGNIGGGFWATNSLIPKNYCCNNEFISGYSSKILFNSTSSNAYKLQNLKVVSQHTYKGIADSGSFTDYDYNFILNNVPLNSDDQIIVYSKLPEYEGDTTCGFMKTNDLIETVKQTSSSDVIDLGTY